MSTQSKAKVNLDLSPIKKGVIECDACIHFNSMDQPETITAVIDGLNAEQINRFCNPPLTVNDVFGSPLIKGILDSGEIIQSDLAFIKNVEFGSGSVQLECYLGKSSQGTGQTPKDRGHWVFGLANYKISIGDEKTALPLSPAAHATPEKVAEINALVEQWHDAFPNSGIPKSPPATAADIKFQPGWRINRITFSFSGREWTLDDDLFSRWPKECDKIAEPIRTGTLTTGYKDGDAEEAVQQIADDITDLLSLALGRDIKWVTSGRRQENGLFQSLHYRKPGLLAFNQHRGRLADNWEPVNLKSFLEAGEKVITSDREWWCITIGILTQVGGTKQLLVKCSLLNTLLDRITSKVNGDNSTAEIDARLDAKLDDPAFRAALNSLFTSLTNKWESHRTDSLCDNVIKGWNAEPSFPEKVIRACDKLGVKAPSRSKLGLRHKIIHTGEFDKKLKTIEKKAEYLFGIEAIVLMLLLRMLGFEGFIYIQSIPPIPDYKKVSEFLAESTNPNGGA